MTAKELKEALANVPDDAEVLISVYSEDLGCDVPCPTHKVVKNVVEGEGNEPYNSIGEDIKQAITGIEVSNKYRVSITIEAL